MANFEGRIRNLENQLWPTHDEEPMAMRVVGWAPNTEPPPLPENANHAEREFHATLQAMDASILGSLDEAGVLA